MATNAPYYHMRGGQFTNSANASFLPDHAVAAEYDLPAPAASNLSPNDATPAAVLPSYAYPEQQPSEESEVPIPSLEDNHHFVELLEAATTAAAGQASRVNNTQMDSAASLNSAQGKRKRVSSSPPADDGTASAEQSKRAKVDAPSAHLHLHDTDGGARERSESSSVSPSNGSLLNDARAAGVHSAAALFRRTSEKSGRKYTRPPMSKLFISLQLTPENFLHLQAQAKSYMLDPAHPERQNCVGNRGKGDTDMVKLRLFNCVRDFLSDNVGEQYFGEGVEKPHRSDTMEAARALGQIKLPTEDKLVWPRDGNRIISLVTPLLRRMVTNERQRMYAIETRRGGSKKKEMTPMSNCDETHALADTEQATIQIQPRSQAASPNIVSPVQTQSPQNNDALPTPLPPTTPSSDRGLTTVTHYFESEPTAKFSRGEKLKLPTEQSPELHLAKINIFAAKNGHVLRSEKRFTSIPSAPLLHMTWLELSFRIVDLIKETLQLYPDLQEELDRSASMGPEALRGLAAAATEMHHHNTGASMDSTPNTITVDQSARPPSSQMRPPSSASPSKVALPEYKVGAQTSYGWANISNEQEWVRVKRDLARALWADRVCNVVVTLLP